MTTTTTTTAKGVLPCIYGLLDPRTGETRYIGKANDPRSRIKSHVRDARRRNTPVCAWIRKLASVGLTPEMRVLETECADWPDSERRWISIYRQRGARLLNLADGGNQPMCPREVCQKNANTLNGDLYMSAYLDMMRSIRLVLRKWKGRQDREEVAVQLEQVANSLMRSGRRAKVIAGSKWLAKGRGAI